MTDRNCVPLSWPFSGGMRASKAPSAKCSAPPGTLPHALHPQLVAPRHQPTLAFGLRVRRRQVSRRARQHRSCRS